MIFRAVFWIGLVSLLIPHEPDLGLGRPGAGASLPSQIASLAASGLAKPGEACSTACAGGQERDPEKWLAVFRQSARPNNNQEQNGSFVLGILDIFQNATVRSLDQVKAEIDASVQSRKMRHSL